MFHRSHAVSRTRLIGAGVLSALLLASPLTVSHANAADISLNVLLDGITLNISQRKTLDREYVHYRQQRSAAEARHDARALANARRAYLAQVDRVMDRQQSQRFQRRFDDHYPGAISVNVVRATSRKNAKAYTSINDRQQRYTAHDIQDNSDKRSLDDNRNVSQRHATKNTVTDNARRYARNDTRNDATGDRNNSDRQGKY